MVGADHPAAHIRRETPARAPQMQRKHLGQKLAEEPVLSRRRISRKAHARRAGLSEISQVETEGNRTGEVHLVRTILTDTESAPSLTKPPTCKNAWFEGRPLRMGKQYGKNGSRLMSRSFS